MLRKGIYYWIFKAIMTKKYQIFLIAVWRKFERFHSGYFCDVGGKCKVAKVRTAVVELFVYTYLTCIMQPLKHFEVAELDGFYFLDF